MEISELRVARRITMFLPTRPVTNPNATRMWMNFSQDASDGMNGA
jgi:hypothetical protein